MARLPSSSSSWARLLLLVHFLLSGGGGGHICCRVYAGKVKSPPPRPPSRPPIPMHSPQGRCVDRKGLIHHHASDYSILLPLSHASMLHLPTASIAYFYHSPSNATGDQLPTASIAYFYHSPSNATGDLFRPPNPPSPIAYFYHSPTNRGSAPHRLDCLFLPLTYQQGICSVLRTPRHLQPLFWTARCIRTATSCSPTTRQPGCIRYLRSAKLSACI